MKLISIELYLYKPLMHNGVKHLTVDDMSTITVIAGENGSGKSSLLRECTPYPACRTDYDKGGYKKVVYVHNQKVYTLTSDFRKPNGAHSFLDGDVELNNSGTTEVQEELAASTFGLTDTIRKLISGKYKICDMGKPERKSLIMSTYPSSMSFILDHYKAISSNLRSVLANLKMMLQREQSLRNQMMTTSLLETCVNQRADLNRALTAIDMDVYAIRQAVDHAASSLGNVTEQNLYTEKHEIDELAADLIRQYQQVTGQNTTAIPNSSDIDAELLELDTSIGILKADIQGKTDAAYEIKEEVSRYTDYLNNDSKSNLEECVRLITVQDDIIRNTPLDERFPVLSEEELEYLEKWVPNWVEKIDTLQTMILESKAKEAPTQEAYDKADKEFNDLLQVRSKAEDLAVRLSEDLKRLESRREYQMQHTWPSDCKMLCTLKDNMKTILAQVDDDIRMTRVELEKQNRIVLDTEDRLNTLAEGLQDARPQRGIITYLEGCFFLHSWADFVTNGRSLTEALNSDAIGIRNTLLKLVDNGRNALKVKSAKAMKTVLEAKKVGLENSSAPAENIIREPWSSRRRNWRP